MTWPMWRRVACAIPVLAAAAAPSGAQGGAGSRAGVVLTLPTDARALGAGDASAAASRDAWAIFQSPAQLARVRTAAFGIAAERYLAGTTLTAGAVSVPLGDGTLGIGATLLDYGTIAEIASTIPGTDGVETGREYSAQDNALMVAYARTAAERWRLGGAVELVNANVADLSGRGVAVSAGAATTTAGGWDFAAAVQHIGPAITIGATSGALPATGRFAVAAPARAIGEFTLRPMVEARSIRGAGHALAMAAEATWNQGRGASLVLRGAYTLRTGATEDRWPVSLGAGVVLGSVSVDYAIERFPTIDQVTHRVGLRLVRRAAR